MEQKDRTFRQLEEEKTQEEFDQFATAVTTRYATSELEYSQANVARDNHITSKCLRQLMDYAIIYNKVSLEIATLVKNKAMQKQKVKVQQAGGSSISHHENLMRQRENFLLMAFSRVEIKRIAEDIANHPSKSIHFFTCEYGIETDRLTKMLLKKSIVENIISDDIMELIIKRSLGDNPTEKAKKVFEEFRIEREKNKSKNSP